MRDGERDNAIHTEGGQSQAPVAFGSYKLTHENLTTFPMNREQAIECIVRQLGPDDLVVSTTGKASRELYEYRIAHGSECHDFLTVGGMGHTASIAMGLARALDESILKIEKELKSKKKAEPKKRIETDYIR